MSIRNDRFSIPGAQATVNVFGQNAEPAAKRAKHSNLPSYGDAVSSDNGRVLGKRSVAKILSPKPAEEQKIVRWQDRSAEELKTRNEAIKMGLHKQEDPGTNIDIILGRTMTELRLAGEFDHLGETVVNGKLVVDPKMHKEIRLVYNAEYKCFLLANKDDLGYVTIYVSRPRPKDGIIVGGDNYRSKMELGFTTIISEASANSMTAQPENDRLQGPLDAQYENLPAYGGGANIVSDGANASIERVDFLKKTVGQWRLYADKDITISKADLDNMLMDLGSLTDNIDDETQNIDKITELQEYLQKYKEGSNDAEKISLHIPGNNTLEAIMRALIAQQILFHTRKD